MISASILSIKSNIPENIEKLSKTSIDYIHLDIMDGIFVKNKTWNIEEIKPLIKNSNKPLDVHLMVENVKKYIDDFKILKPEYITFHYEVKKDIMEIIKYIKSLNIKVGLSIKPNTKVEEIIEYLSYIDLVLIMTVEPGQGGQSFITDTLEKIKQLNQIKKDYNFVVEVDGGINKDTIKNVDADIYVVGSYITNDNDYQKQIDTLKK